jgi:hypothetical protein
VNTDDGQFCDLCYRATRRLIKAVVSIYCHVEQKETHLCNTHKQFWTEQARLVPALNKRCPNCAHLANTTLSAKDADIIPLAGPLADAIDRAMHAEGVLVNQRRRVLIRLRQETDPYAGTLLRSTEQPESVS